MKVLGQLAAWSALPLRIVLGIVFFAHGSQKLFGWFGGGGFTETANHFTGLGGSNLPGWLLAALGGGGEFFGGVLVFLGLFTRFGAFLIAATMFVAIFTVHLKSGLFASNNGFEYPLVALAAAFSLILSGSQCLGIDNILKVHFKNRK